MLRWVFAFLLLVVPLQMAWGSAAPYCAHEASVSTKKHFGHHEHDHQAAGEASLADDDLGDEGGAYHADCENCHLGCSAVLHADVPDVQALPHSGVLSYRGPSFTSHVPSGPHRPDRARPTPAARFGGDVVAFSLTN
jgi:hypothetical protein